MNVKFHHITFMNDEKIKERHEWDEFGEAYPDLVSRVMEGVDLPSYQDSDEDPITL